MLFILPQRRKGNEAKSIPYNWRIISLNAHIEYNIRMLVAKACMTQITGQVWFSGANYIVPIGWKEKALIPNDE